MTDRKLTNVAASVRQRLLNRAKAEGRVFQELATLYVMERFLYRLGRSEHAEDATKQAQWAGFVRKSRLEAPGMAEVVEVAAGLAEGGFEVARRGR